MIAFASVFLMKVATKWNTVGFNIDPTFVWELLDRVIHLLKTTITSKRHLLYHIAAGLEKMRARLLEQDDESGSGSQSSARAFTTLGKEGNLHEDGSLSASQQLNRNDESGVSQRYSSINTWSDAQLASPGGLTTVEANVSRRAGSGPDPEFDQIMSMSNDLIYEVFGGNESSYDVYNMLSSQFAP